MENDSQPPEKSEEIASPGYHYWMSDKNKSNASMPEKLAEVSEDVSILKKANSYGSSWNQAGTW